MRLINSISLMEKYIFKAPVLLFCLFVSSFVSAQNPKLIVGIVVDQMRFDHLYLYADKYGEDGFKRLIREGFQYKNTHYNYVPTVTAAGHASVYTGTTPATHGIIGNSWYDRSIKGIQENVTDFSKFIIGSKEENKIGKSPHNLKNYTITDQLKMGTNFRSKVISVSLKDRGAILPGGHTADAAYWHDYQSSPGYFVSSDYYMEALPNWVTLFNESGRSDYYLDTVWNTLFPIEEYTESAEDNNPYENTLSGNLWPEFPYDLKFMKEVFKRRGNEYHLLWVTPMGNSLLAEFAKTAIKEESLGKHEFTDMLCVSFSVPDVAGHTFGSHSVEMEDIFLRLDQEIAGLLDYLDEYVGKGAYTLFLTSDHAAITTVSYLNDHKLPSGLADINFLRDTLSVFLQEKYGKREWIEYFGEDQVYLDRALIKERKVDLFEIQNAAAGFLTTLKGVRYALTAEQLQKNEYTKGIPGKLQSGFYPERSGDILLSYDPGYITEFSGRKMENIKGTTHRSGHAYDSHVPLIWFGAGIPQGESVRMVHPTDIAPTLALKLNLEISNNPEGEVLKELWEN